MKKDFASEGLRTALRRASSVAQDPRTSSGRKKYVKRKVGMPTFNLPPPADEVPEEEDAKRFTKARLKG